MMKSSIFVTECEIVDLNLNYLSMDFFGFFDHELD